MAHIELHRWVETSEDSTDRQRAEAYKALLVSALMQVYYFDLQLRNVEPVGPWLKDRIHLAINSTIDGGAFFDNNVTESVIDAIAAEWGIDLNEERE